MERLISELHLRPDSWVRKLEDEVLPAILSSAPRESEILREQLKRAEVTVREFSGSGFFSTFSVNPDAPALSDHADLHLGESVRAVIGNPPIDVGFVLHIKNGIVDYFECFSFDGSFPDPNDDVRFSITNDKSNG